MRIDDEMLDVESLQNFFGDFKEEMIQSLENHGLFHRDELTEIGEYLLSKSNMRPYAYEKDDESLDYFYLPRPYTSRLGCILEMERFAKRAKTYEDRSKMLSPVFFNLEPEMMKTALIIALLHTNEEKGTLIFKHTIDGAIITYPSKNIDRKYKTIPKLLYKLGVLKNDPYPYIKYCASKAHIKDYSTYGKGKLFFPFGKRLDDINPFAIPMNEKENIIMSLAHVYGRITRKAVVNKLELGSPLASYYLNSLFKKDLLKRVGNPRSRSCYYVPTDKYIINSNL